MGKRVQAVNTYETIFEEHPDVLFVMDDEGKILKANQAAVKAYGYDGAELKAMRIHDLHYRGMQAGTEVNVLNTDSVYDTFHRRKDGGIMPVEVKSRGVNLESEKRIIVAIRELPRQLRGIDPSPEKQAVEQKEQITWNCDAIMQRRYEAITVGIIVYDLHGMIIYANRMAEKILNCSWHEMRGASCRNPKWQIFDATGRIVSHEAFPSFISTNSRQAVHSKVLGLQRTASSPIQWIMVNSKPVIDPQTKNMVEVIATFSDITALRSAEEALRKSERRLIFAIRSIHAGEWELNLQDDSVQYSSRCASIFLGDPQFDGLQSHYNEVLDYFLAEDRETVHRIVHEAVQNKKPFDVEGRIVRADGEKRWIQLSGQPYEVDACAGVMGGILIDITEKKLAQISQRQAIIHSHNTFMNEIINNFNFPFFILDKDCCYTAFNQIHADSMKLLFGAYIAVGREYLSYLTVHSDRNIMERNLKRVLSGETFAYEHFFCVEGRSRKCYELVHCPIRNENRQIIGASIFAHDVTERKTVQESLQAREYRYRKLVEDTNLIILQLDEQGGITFMNEFGCEFFQYALTELIGKRFDEIFFPDVSSSGRDTKELFSYVLCQKSALVQHVTSELVTRSKKRVWVDWSYHWAADPNQPGKVLIAGGVDMTRAIRSRLEEKHGYQRRRRQELMNEAISKRFSQEEFSKMAGRLNISLPYQLLCLLLRNEGQSGRVASKSEEWQRQADLLIDWLHKSGVGMVWQAEDGEIGIVLSLQGESKKEQDSWARKTAKELTQQVLRYSSATPWQCGISQTTRYSFAVAELYFQAQTALSFGPALLGPRTLYHWQDLGSYQLLVKDIHSDNTAQFVADQLGPLFELGKNDHSTELFNTLRELVTLDSLEEIARRLHVHRGTVRYRRNVLGKLLERDLDSIENLLNLSIAIKIWEALNRYK